MSLLRVQSHVISSQTIQPRKKNSLSACVMEDKRPIHAEQKKVIQGMLTRSASQRIVGEMITAGEGAEAYLRSLEGLDEFDKALIWDEYCYRTRKLVGRAEDDLEELSSEDGHDEDERPGNEELSPAEVSQLRRASYRESDRKDFPTSVSGSYSKVSYTTDAKGGIDFSKYTKKVTWKNPIKAGSCVCLNTGSLKSDYGKLQNNNYVQIRGASRAQHFNIANRLNGDLASGNASPTNYTWHHLLQYPYMVLVDREVHRKYGHNGGFLLW